MNSIVGQVSNKMMGAAAFGQIIILIVYLPILSLTGIEGKMFKPMAFTIAFAIFGAFILSITYVPMMAALFLNKKLNHKMNITDRLMIWLERAYQPFLKTVLKLPKTVIGITVLLFFFSVGLLMKMGGEFIPQLEEGDFAVETRVLTGSNLNNTVASTQKATKLLLQNFPEVEKIVTKIGSAEIPTDPMPFEAGDMMIILKDKKDFTVNKNKRIAALVEGFNKAKSLSMDTVVVNKIKIPEKTNINTTEKKVNVSVKKQPEYVYKVYLAIDNKFYYIDDADGVFEEKDNGTFVKVGEKRTSTRPGFDWLFIKGENSYGVDLKGRLWVFSTDGNFKVIGQAVKIN